MDVNHLAIHDSVRAVFPPERLRDALESVEPQVTVATDDDSLAGVDAVVTFEHRDAFLDHARWVHSIQAGYDRFPLDEFERRGIVLTNSTGIHGTSVGETVAGLLLLFARRLHQYVRQQSAREWARPEWDEAFTLEGKRLCVVGLGTLGRGVAERGAALGMDVVGVRRSGEPVPGVREVYASDRLHAAIGDADFVAVTLPLTEETRGLFDGEAFAAMREDAYFVNVGRGDVVDEDALVAALRDGTIAGAGLDVFEEEPLPEDSPLWGMDEVIVTPHCAAMTRDYYRDIADLVRRNLERVDVDEEMVNRVV